MPPHITTYHVVVTRELQIACGGMETHLTERELETFYLKSTTTSLWGSKMSRFGIVVTFDERYEFVKLYDILRDMDFELTPLQESVFEKIEMGVDKVEF